MCLVAGRGECTASERVALARHIRHRHGRDLSGGGIAGSWRRVTPAMWFMLDASGRIQNTASGQGPMTRSGDARAPHGAPPPCVLYSRLDQATSTSTADQHRCMAGNDATAALLLPGGGAKNARTPPTYGSTMAPGIFPGLVRHATLAACVLLAGCGAPPSKATPVAAATSSATLTEDALIPAYRARFNRARAVIAVVGENTGVEISDFLVPFAIRCWRSCANADCSQHWAAADR